MLPQLTLAAGVGLVVLIAVLSAWRAGIRPRREQPGPRVRRRRLPDGTSVPARSRARARTIRYTLRGLGLAVTLFVLGQAALTVQAFGRLQHGATVMREAAGVLGTDPTRWTASRLRHAEVLLDEARADIQPAERRIAGDPFLDLGSVLPWVRGEVATARDLSRAAVATTSALGDTFGVAGAVLDESASNGPAGTRLLDLVGATTPRWHATYNTLAPAVAALRRDEAESLAPPLRQAVDSTLRVLDPAVALAQVGALAGDYAPSALGAQRPRTYLLLLANPSEIRPSGGFVGSLGTVTFDGGVPVSVVVKAQDTYNPLLKDRVPVPAPLNRYLTFYKDSLEIGDAGWDPDFPTTARLSEQLFTSATGTAVDGTISLDPYAVQDMLAVTGPVTVPGYGSFDSTNFFTRLNFIVNASTAKNAGKRALAPISQAVLRHVLNLPATSWPRFFTELKHAADGRHIQAYAHDPNLAAAIASAHYDGSIVGGHPDYLMVADANVGATKGDAFARRSMNVLTEVRPTGVAVHQVVIDYSMPAPGNRADAALNPGDGSYRDYVRLYVPAAADIVSLSVTVDGKTSQGTVDDISLDHGLCAVGAFVDVPRGHRSSVTLTYEVPVAAGASYSLYVQKEMGTASLPTDFTLSYPGGITREHAALDRDTEVAARW